MTMFESVISWMDNQLTGLELNQPWVIELGSLDRKQTRPVRPLFSDAGYYVGVDIKQGNNVDVVLDVCKLSQFFVGESFDVVLALHVLEHIAQIWIALGQIRHVLKSGGYLFMSIPTYGFPEHNYPKDYWRASEDCVREIIMDGFEVIDLHHDKSKFSKHPFINCLGRKE